MCRADPNLALLTSVWLLTQLAYAQVYARPRLALPYCCHWGANPAVQGLRAAAVFGHRRREAFSYVAVKCAPPTAPVRALPCIGCGQHCLLPTAGGGLVMPLMMLPKRARR